MLTILTVVPVLELTVGETLSKSLNQGCATLLAGGLGIGEKGKPVYLGLMVFFFGAVCTFTRFLEVVKKRHDDGVKMFILTFTCVVVSGFRVDEVMELAHQRLSTILIGGALCMVMSIFVWPGHDLQNLISANIEQLGASLEGFGSEYRIFQGDESSKTSSFVEGNEIMLNSKTKEESLANFAWWEPPHGRLRSNRLWKQYLKVGDLARECACLIQALHGYINSKSQSFVESQVQMKFKELSMKMSIMESGMALKEISSAIKTTTFGPLSAAGTHLQNSKFAADDHNSMLENWSVPNLQEIVPLHVIASLLTDIVDCIDRISVLVNELLGEACVENNTKSTTCAPVHEKPVNDDNNQEHVVVEVRDGASAEKVNHHTPSPQ